MTDLREAARQALEALCNIENESDEAHTIKQCQPQILALRAALAREPADGSYRAAFERWAAGEDLSIATIAEADEPGTYSDPRVQLAWEAARVAVAAECERCAAEARGELADGVACGNVDAQDAARRILQAIEAQVPGYLPEPAIPAGWRLVPEEPTSDMRNAFHAVTDDDVLSMGAAGSRWHAMLSAAPAAPAKSSPDESLAAPALPWAWSRRDVCAHGIPWASACDGCRPKRRSAAPAVEGEPEPVAEVYDTFGNSQDPTKCTGHVWLAPGYFPARGTKLYAAPPAKREPLTDEQIADVCCDAMAPWVQAQPGSMVHSFARGIERAHNITGA